MSFAEFVAVVRAVHGGNLGTRRLSWF
jgi:hypothetical protein